MYDRLSLPKELIIVSPLQGTTGPPEDPSPRLLTPNQIKFNLQHATQDEVQNITCEEVINVLKNCIILPIYINQPIPNFNKFTDPESLA